jgi:hypothetical protein
MVGVTGFEAATPTSRTLDGPGDGNNLATPLPPQADYFGVGCYVPILYRDEKPTQNTLYVSYAWEV